MAAIMYPSGKKLLGTEAPLGIVSLELARTPARAREILAAWSQKRVLGDAVTNVWLDCGFILFYSNALSLACVMVAEAIPKRRQSRVAGLAWAAWLAGVCDSVENVAMLLMLERPERVEGPLPGVTFCCAVSKFALVGATLSYAIGGALHNATRSDPR